MIKKARNSAPREKTLLWYGVLCVMAMIAVSGSFYSYPDKATQQSVVFISVTGMICAVLFWRTQTLKRARALLVHATTVVTDNSKTPSFVSNQNFKLLYRNDAALKKFGGQSSDDLGKILKFTFANPQEILAILAKKALKDGEAELELSTSATKIRMNLRALDHGLFFWSCVDAGQGAVPPSEEQSLPMLSASKSGTVLYMNDALRQLLGMRVKSLDRIFNDLPVRNGQENEIVTPNGPQKALVAEISGTSGRREIYLLPAQATIEAANCGQLFEGLPVPMLKMNDSGMIIEANQLARCLLGEKNAVGQGFGDLVQGLGRSVADWLADAAAGRGLNKSEVLRARKPVDDVYVQVSLSLSHEGGASMLVAVLTDATELKTLEAQFVQSQKMQAIGQLAGGIAHDFNNLLTAISGHCDLLLLRHDLGDPDYSDLIQINQNSNRAASLVGQLLAFSRKQNLQPESIDLRDTMSDLTHLLNRLVGETVMLTHSHDPNLKLIRADKRQFEQVLMNLVVNARDAMPDGGEIRIETKNLTLTSALKRDRAVVPAGNYVVISVCDAGIGIPPDKIGKIFEPFYTTKKVGEGTGLGLSTVYGIVKQSGGYIFVDPNRDEGVCFSIYLPEHRPTKEKLKPKEVILETGPVRGDGVILLVEDEAPVRAFASRALRMRGYTVLEAENAEVALETLEDADLKIDIFVTDVIMPGLDGPTWVKQAMKTRPDVKVVFVSGYAEDDFADNQQQIPNSVFLAKPFSLKELTNTVHRQLH